VKTITIKIDDLDYEILETDMVDVQEWVENAVREKIRRLTDRLVEEHSEFQAHKIDQSKKKEILKKVKLPKARDRNVEMLEPWTSGQPRRVSGS